MPRFAFEAVDQGGKLVRGSLEAATRNLALEQLIAGGQTPVALDEGQGHTGVRAGFASMVGVRRFDYLSMLRELGTLLKAGLPVERALGVLRSLATESRRALRLHQILERVRGGEPLSQAFGTLVPEAPAHLGRLLAAGEASGHLPEVVARIAAALARSKALRDRLVSSLTYPCLLVVAMIAVLWFVFSSVLPRLTPLFAQAGASLPTPTAVLLAMGQFFHSYGIWLAFLAAITLLSLGYALRRADLRIHIDHTLLTRRLFFGLPLHYEAARFCRNLETLLAGGLPLDRALSAAREASGNLWFRARLAHTQNAVAEGERLKFAFGKSGVLPPLVLEFAAVGEETGRLAAMMGEVAAILDHEVELWLERLTALVLPAATLLMGALIAGIMAGIVSGILAVNDFAK